MNTEGGILEPKSVLKIYFQALLGKSAKKTEGTVPKLANGERVQAVQQFFTNISINTTF